MKMQGQSSCQDMNLSYGGQLMKWCPASLPEASLWEILFSLFLPHPIFDLSAVLVGSTLKIYPDSNHWWLTISPGPSLSNLLDYWINLDYGNSSLTSLSVSTLQHYSCQKDLLKTISQIMSFLNLCLPLRVVSDITQNKTKGFFNGLQDSAWSCLFLTFLSPFLNIPALPIATYTHWLLCCFFYFLYCCSPSITEIFFHPCGRQILRRPPRFPPLGVHTMHNPLP